MENITFAIENLKCEKCGTTCKTKSIYDRHVAACDYEEDEPPYQMPERKTFSTDQLYDMYTPTESDKTDYDNRVSDNNKKQNNTEFVCECGKVCELKGNLKKHKLNCKFIKAKTQVDEQKQNDQQIIDELRAELAAKDAELAAKDAQIYELQTKNEQYLDKIFSIAGNNSSQIAQQIPQQIIYQPPMPRATEPKKIKFDPYEFLSENVDTAIDRETFRTNMQITPDDFNKTLIEGDILHWYVSIFHREVKRQITDVKMRPFHFILDKNTKSIELYSKKEDDKTKEWISNTDDTHGFFTMITTEIRKRLLRYEKMAKEEQHLIDNQAIICEIDDEPDQIKMSWDKKEPTNEWISNLWDMRVAMSQLNDMNKQIMKAVRDKYTL